jgi:hypothetical protein
MIGDDIKLVGDVIKKKYGNLPRSSARFGWQSPALNTLDCVLSLNRRYDGFVVPRIEAFRTRNPKVDSLEQLFALMKKHESSDAFVKNELNYNDQKRASILEDVTKYLFGEQSEFPEATQMQRLERWANSVRPGDAYFTGIKGFSLSGFQYLRMLFGAHTVKPDVHIKRFVSEIVGRKINDVYALIVIERAARKVSLSAKDIDGAIWSERARKI